MIDVEHRALRALEKNALPAAAGVGQLLPDAGAVGQHLGRNLLQHPQVLVEIKLWLAHAARQRAVMAEQLGQCPAQAVFVGEVGQAYRPAGDFVLVGGADAAPGSPDFLSAACPFPGVIQRGMHGQDQRRVLSDAEAALVDLQPQFAAALDLVDQRPGVEHDAVTDQSLLALAHHTGRQQRQRVGDIVDDQRVAGVMPALKPHHHVGAFGQPVHDFAFSFVAPLGAYDSHVRHVQSSRCSTSV